MTDALAPVDVKALEQLPLDAQIDALGEALRNWGRMEVTAVWSFGCSLRFIKAGRPRREWPGIRDRIGIARETARRYMLLADSYDSAQIGQFCTVDAALQAIAPKRISPAPAPPPQPAPVDLEPDPNDVIDAVAVEAGPTAENLREGRLERLAIITEDIGDVDGKLVDAWAAKFDRQAAREREHVSTIKAQARTIAALKRKDRDVRDTALCLPPSPEVSAFLAKYWNVAQKAA